MISIRQLAPAQAPQVESPFRVDVRALDALLADGALAAGQVTEWLGPPSSGKTAVLAAFARAALGRGLAVAWVDARRRLLPGEWADAGPGLFWVARPPLAGDAAFCAEVLLRTGCFCLVVLDEAPPLHREELLRLQRLAKQGGSSLAVLGERPAEHRVHRRFRLERRVLAPESTLQARTEPTWRLEITRADGEPRVLYLTGQRLMRLAVHTLRPDRPQSRTRPGTRYGV